jgi:hypothetical protein
MEKHPAKSMRLHLKQMNHACWKTGVMEKQGRTEVSINLGSTLA